MCGGAWAGEHAHAHRHAHVTKLAPEHEERRSLRVSLQAKKLGGIAQCRVPIRFDGKVTTQEVGDAHLARLFEGSCQNLHAPECNVERCGAPKIFRSLSLEKLLPCLLKRFV